MLELLTADEMLRAEQITIDGGTPSLTLMENAGRAVAEEVVRRFPRGSKVSICCGRGNNGGDAFVCARILRERGFQIRLGLLGKPEELKAEPKEMARRWDETIEPLTVSMLEGTEVVVDGIMGSGLKGPVNGEIADIIQSVNDKKIPVVAIDMPTGIEMTHGSVQGIAFESVSTVTFFRKKTGQVQFPGKKYCGDVRVSDIGISNKVLADIAPQTFVNEPDFWLRYYPRLNKEGHKYDRGHAVVVSGPMESTGASRLSAAAALRIGVGLVSLATSKAAFYVNAAQLTSIMLSVYDGSAGLGELLTNDPRQNAVLIGPGAGLSQETCENVAAVLSSEATVIIDAEGLTAFEQNPQDLFGLIQGRSAPTIITPHKGEFDRIFPELGNAESKLVQAKRAAEISGSVVIFKGPITIISAPDGLSAVMGDAPPWLATAGTGDILAGMITGLCAQGMSPFDAAAAAVWMHAELARTFGPGMISEDMPDLLPPLLQRLNKIMKLF